MNLYLLQDRCGIVMLKWHQPTKAVSIKVAIEKQHMNWFFPSRAIITIPQYLSPKRKTQARRPVRWRYTSSLDKWHDWYERAFVWSGLSEILVFIGCLPLCIQLFKLLLSRGDIGLQRRYCVMAVKQLLGKCNWSLPFKVERQLRGCVYG